MILPTLALAADLCGSKTPPTGYRLGTVYERLVAVALIPGRDFGRTQGWDDYCKLPSTFNAGWFPAEAAIGTTTFIVHPAGTHGCGAVVSGATAVAAEAPLCR